MDAPTFAELRSLLKERRSESVRSLNEVVDMTAKNTQLKAELSALPHPTGVIECSNTSVASWFIRVSFLFHRLIRHNQHLPSLSTLGFSSHGDLQNCYLILERAQTLAEMDLREGP